MKNYWTGDWQSKLFSTIKECGYCSLREFLNANPGKDYMRLGDELCVAPAQISIIQFEEAIQNNHVKESAMDALVREMSYHLKKGWGLGARCEFKTASVYGDWVAKLLSKSDSSDIEKMAERTWRFLKESNPPDGWLPEDINDKYIQTAFSKGWIEREEKT